MIAVQNTFRISAVIVKQVKKNCRKKNDGRLKIKVMNFHNSTGYFIYACCQSPYSTVGLAETFIWKKKQMDFDSGECWRLLTVFLNVYFNKSGNTNCIKLGYIEDSKEAFSVEKSVLYWEDFKV